MANTILNFHFDCWNPSLITSREDKDTFFCPYSIPSYTPLAQVPEDLHKLKKTLSDKTKRKIAENNRKFSVCKLCRWKSWSPLWWLSLWAWRSSSSSWLSAAASIYPNHHHHHLHLHLLQKAMPGLPRSYGPHAHAHANQLHHYWHIIIIIIVIFIFCSKQCRGFRGLVDHMHRDHSDYKPWQCSHCPTKTAFVKTLYRYIRPKHYSALTILPRQPLLKLCEVLTYRFLCATILRL